jgi:hypothetical protein
MASGVNLSSLRADGDRWGTIPKKPAPDLIRSGSRFSDKIMLQRKYLDHDPIQPDGIMA